MEMVVVKGGGTRVGVMGLGGGGRRGGSWTMTSLMP
jgi:hypothetical protein